MNEFSHPALERGLAIPPRHNRYRPPARNWLLILTAGFACVWIVHRALVQSITLDEANTFLHWVSPDTPTHWDAHSNNHVLNSLLMRLSVWLFGLSHLTVRMPALFGGALYIFAIYGFCTLLGGGPVLTWALFVCFVYNPFLMDYLVAARGYGLALGFFGMALYLFAGALVRAAEPGEREILNRARAVSACVALSFCANFSFAWANAFLLAAFFIWAFAKRRKRGKVACARLATACAFPGFVVVFVLTGSVLARFPRDQLFWGSHSLKESWRDIFDASFTQSPLNPFLVNPLLADFLRSVQPYFFRVGAALLAVYLAFVLLARKPRSFQSRPRLLLAASLAAVLVLTVFVHWLQFKLLKIPLPFERTSLFLVPLTMAIVGAVFSVAPSNLRERAVRGLGIAVLCLTAVYFVGALRDSFFRMWRPGADVKAAFPVVVNLCRRAGVREVASDQNLAASFNFYRILYKVDDLDEFRYLDKMPSGKPIYVLMERQYADLIRREGLQIAYRGPTSDLVVAIRPGATLGR